MKNPVIFTPSNAHLLAGHLWPYHGKGFFHAYTSSEVYKQTAACPYRTGENPVARLTGVFDSDNRRVAFFVCLHSVKCRTHHATSRNHTSQSAAHSTQTFSPTLANPKQDGQATSAHGIKAFGPDKQDVRALFLTISAIPPAAFSTHYFLNLAQCE